MKNKLYISLIIFLLSFNYVFSQNEPFSMRVINPGYQLNSAWEITWGPDDSLWVTENFAYLVSRIDPITGGKTVLIDLSSKKDFTSPPRWPQGGLMGMALHPTLYSEWPNASKPWVYLAYVYHYNTSTGCSSNGSSTSPCRFNTKIVRYDYDRATHTLSNEQVIISSLNGSNDHNSGRLTIGKVDDVPYLFYTIGDMGAGQFNNINRTNNAQTRDTLEGKVLRFNMEPDGDAGALDKWIPNDNPFTDANSKPTAVWSWGHRNAQGIVFGSNGKLYQSEQQDKSDDEVNIIDSARNYGWPRVSGYCDGNYNGLTLANKTVHSEQDSCTALNVKEPIYTLFSDPNPGALGSNYLTWPTVACSSIDVYEKSAIPYWNRSLLVTSLKAGQIFRLKLDPTGTSVIDSSTIPAMRNQGRYRDICISPDGLKIYAACDISGQTSGPTGSYNGGGTQPTHAGRILEFTYTGPIGPLAINDSVNTYTRNTVIQVFPNPASKILYIKSIKNVSKPLHYLIYNTTGKLVLKGNSNNDYFSVDVETLTPGIYIFKLFNAYNINLKTEKIMIK
ncbi:MAG: PQQ-dependent sugar dehydrogenase [Bacteroidota bacterium]|nr:PQQ-dependent sugar dehydrogenase [Bacteroidota bacterium]